MEEVKEKVCFKCHQSLPLSMFYAHKQMADGHLNKCKNCTKKDVHQKYIENIESNIFVEKERKRGREKYHRLYKGKSKSSHKEIHDVRRWFSVRIKIPDGCELHHWNYNKINSVFQLTRSEHARIHKAIKYDEVSKTFVVKDSGEKLDNIQKSFDFIKKFAPNVTFYDFEK